MKAFIIYFRENITLTSVFKKFVIGNKDAHMRLQILGNSAHDVICAVHKSLEKNFCNHV